MQSTDYTNQKNASENQYQPSFVKLNARQKTGLFLLSGITLAIASIMPMIDDLANQTMEASISSVSRDIARPFFQADPFSLSDLINSNDVFTLPSDEIIPQEEIKASEKRGDFQDWQEYLVQSGDNLSSIFNKMSLSQDQMYELLKNKDAKLFNQIRPGQELSFLIDSELTLQKISIKIDNIETVTFSSSKNGYKSKIDRVISTWMPTIIAGRIRGSFYESAKKAGLSPNQAQRIVNIFQWQINFSKDLKQGDSFNAIISKEYISGSSTGKTEIKAVQINTGGRAHMVFLHENGQFYNERGESLEQGFLRIPLARTPRISSDFNLHRKHPITGRVSQHQGTDYAVPSGTTVIAPSGGTVIKVTKHPLAGNYIVIRHGRQYTTRYLHLSRALVKEGDKVSRGQKIALTGNTGRSTGPHLHYEVHVNNKPVDPRTVKLPMAEGLSGKSKKEFLTKVESYKKQLKLNGNING